VAVAVSSGDVAPPAWESWIAFDTFGSAAAGSGGTTQEDFKVDFGERLVAPEFHLTLGDDKVIKAIKEDDPVPKAEIGGTLDGNFNFALERGQGAQTFP